MAFNRREFLKVAGLSTALGLGGKGAVELLWPGEVEASELAKRPRALEGKRWGMVVDTRKFKKPEDFEACTKACHVAHNVPDVKNKRIEIKWIWTAYFFQAFTEQENAYLGDINEGQVLVMCNHCDNPPCVRVCPTKATFQREDGIVFMDFHRCIGCRFCMGACPYGSRSFNFGDPRKVNDKAVNPKFPSNGDFPTRTKGVVEKCNFCAERLAQGLMPACVEASRKQGAGGIYFGDLADPNSEVRKALRQHFTIRRKPSLGTHPSVFYIV